MPSIALAGPGRAMMVKPGIPALWRPTATASSGGGSGFAGPYPSAISGLAGWWDAGNYSGLVDSNGVALPSWNNAVGGISDKSGVSTALVPYHFITTPAAPQATPRLNGQLGGVGLNTVTPPALPAAGSVPASGYVLPQMDEDTGFSLANGAVGSGSAWTLYFVWSRPNWPQGYGAPTTTITLLQSGSTPEANAILGADAQAGSNARLILFPGSSQTILTSSLERRHTHSIIITNTPGAGVSVWLDGNEVATAAHNPLPSSVSGPLLFLHNAFYAGSAQCWFHEAAVWNRALSGNDITTLLSCATRWTRGARKGVQLFVMGQSNAGYEVGQDYSWHLCAQGIAWHLGALAYSIIGLWAASGTCISGAGISNEPFSDTDAEAAAGGYPASFLEDPGDGSDPAGWALGAQGLGVQSIIQAAPADDVSDIGLIVWPWGETDAIRAYSDKTKFEHAQVNLLAKVRAMIGKTASQLPLMLWNMIPCGISTNAGSQMIREASADLVANPGQNAFIGLPMTADSNPRNGQWNAATGVFTAISGTDPDHRDATDNIRFGRLAAPVAARAIMAASGGDAFSSIPSGIPVIGGPYISHVYQATAYSTTIILTITHDCGTDLIVGLQATTGVGFFVMDGGSVASPGNVIAATACARVDATHLQITLASAPSNTQSSLLFFYTYGTANIYRGNAVYDNYSTMAPPSGWNIAGDLGSAWALNYPLAATTMPIVVSATP